MTRGALTAAVLLTAIAGPGAAAPMRYSPWLSPAQLAGADEAAAVARLTGQAALPDWAWSTLRTTDGDIRALDPWFSYRGERPNHNVRCELTSQAGRPAYLVFVRGRLAGAAEQLPDSLEAAEAPMPAVTLRAGCEGPLPYGSDREVLMTSKGGRLFARLKPGQAPDSETMRTLERDRDIVERRPDAQGVTYRIQRKPPLTHFKSPWDFVFVRIAGGRVAWTADGGFASRIGRDWQDAGRD